MTNNYLIVRLRKTGGKLVYPDKANESLYEQFKKQLPEGAVVQLYLEEVSDDGSLGQLAKVHAMIRELSLHTGMPFTEIKTKVKQKAGLKMPGIKELKSFGDCNRAELASAILAAMEIGESVNCPVG